jgi:hypothetical protein
MASFLILMIKFEFKRKMLTNQDTPPSYWPVTDGTAIGTNPAGSNGDGTTHPERLLPI